MAAMCVMLMHFFFAFLPRYMRVTNLRLPDETQSGAPFFVFNGHAMVVIFFILSGYVLSLKGLRPDAGRLIANAAIKRWFRLSVPVFISLLFSWSLFLLGLYHYDDVYARNGSVWMHKIFGEFSEVYKPSFKAIAYTGFIGIFLSDDSSFNNPVWTISWEFCGSMLVFMLALLLVPHRRWLFMVALPLAAILVFNVHSIWIFPMLAGQYASIMGLEHWKPVKTVAIATLVLGLYLCGYFYPQGCYAWLDNIPLQEKPLNVLVLTVGGFLVFSIFVSQNCISRHFTGALSRFAGRISFPLYLLHVPVIASFCSASYLAVNGAASGVAAAALALLLILPPLVWFASLMDKAWLRTLASWQPFVERVPA